MNANPNKRHASTRIPPSLVSLVTTKLSSAPRNPWYVSVTAEDWEEIRMLLRYRSGPPETPPRMR